MSYRGSGIGIGAIRNVSKDILTLTRYCGATEVSSLEKVDGGYRSSRLGRAEAIV